MIHGRLPALLRRGGAEAKGGFRFAGAGRSCLRWGTDPRQRAAIAPIAGSVTPFGTSGACLTSICGRILGHPVPRALDSDPSICYVMARCRILRAALQVQSFGGRLHGRTRRLGELGELGSRRRMADMYEAHDPLLGRIGAIRVLAPAFHRGRSFVERFSRRPRVAGHLS